MISNKLTLTRTKLQLVKQSHIVQSALYSFVAFVRNSSRFNNHFPNRISQQKCSLAIQLCQTDQRESFKITLKSFCGLLQNPVWFCARTLMIFVGTLKIPTKLKGPLHKPEGSFQGPGGYLQEPEGSLLKPEEGCTDVLWLVNSIFCETWI